jgi:hypothetical protein
MEIHGRAGDRRARPRGNTLILKMMAKKAEQVEVEDRRRRRWRRRRKGRGSPHLGEREAQVSQREAKEEEPEVWEGVSDLCTL